MKRTLIAGLALATTIIVVENANAAPRGRNVILRKSVESAPVISRNTLIQSKMNSRNTPRIHPGIMRNPVKGMMQIGQKVRPINVGIKKPYPINKPLPIAKPLPFPKPVIKKPLPFPKPVIKKPILKPPVIGGKKILPIGGKVFNHGKNFKFNKHYHLWYGKKYHFGFCYHGKHHHHWAHCCWLPNYGCYGYYCPCTCCYYYWCEPVGCFYPVTYCPTGWYCY